MSDPVYTSPFQGYDPGVSGLAQLGRNAIERMTELERALAERDETIRKLRDPVFVHVAMLRGDIAVPPLAEMLHIYGATFSDAEAANIELAKARETIDRLRAENAALREGAERYRWLRDAWYLNVNDHRCLDELASVRTTQNAAEFDAAIDAARLLALIQDQNAKARGAK